MSNSSILGLPLFWNTTDLTESGEDTFMRWMLICEYFMYGAAILNLNQAAPTGSEDIGDAYDTSGSPSGDFAGHADECAILLPEPFGWTFLDWIPGMKIFNIDTGNWLLRDDTNNWDTYTLV